MAGHALLLAAALLVAAAAQAPEFSPWELSPRGRAAYGRLLEAQFFAVGGVGFGAETSEGEAALRGLLGEPKARAALESLAARATREGGLYALLGLRVTGSDSFASEARRFRERPDESAPRRGAGGIVALLEQKPGKVAAAQGCVFYTEEWEKVLRRIEAGRYDDDFKAVNRQPKEP